MKECIAKGYKNVTVRDLKDYDPEDNLLEEASE